MILQTYKIIYATVTTLSKVRAICFKRTREIHGIVVKCDRLVTMD